MRRVNYENLRVGGLYYTTENKDTCFRFHHFIRRNHQDLIATVYVSGEPYYAHDEHGYYIFSNTHWWENNGFKFGR